MKNKQRASSKNKRHSSQVKNDNLSTDEVIKKYNKIKQELEKTREELAIVQRKHQELFENTNDAIFTFTLDGTFLSANHNAARMFEFQLENLSDYKATTFIPDDGLGYYLKKIDELKEKKKLPLYEREFITASGKSFIGELNVSLIESTRTNEMYIQSIIRDVSERKKYERLLNLERRAYKTIAYWITNAETKEVFAEKVLSELITIFEFEIGTVRILDEDNQALEAIAYFGIAADKEKHIGPQTIIEPDTISAYVFINRLFILAPDALESKELMEYHDRLKIFNILSIISCPLINTNNEAVGCIHLSATKTKQFSEEDRIFFESIATTFGAGLEYFIQREALTAAYNERAQLDRIINLSPAVVFFWDNDPNWTVLFVSENIEQFGYTVDDFLSGKVRFSEIIHPDDISRVQTEVQLFSVNKNLNEFTQQYRIITNDGQIKWVVDYTTVCRDENDDVEHYHGIILDISEQEEAIQKLNNEREAYKIIAQAALKSRDLNELCQYILPDLLAALDFEVGTIRLYNEEDDTLYPVSQMRVEEIQGTIAEPLKVSTSNYLVAYVARELKGDFSPDIDQSKLPTSYILRLKEVDVKAIITWPLKSTRNKLLGTLQLVSQTKKELTTDDEYFFEYIATNMGLAIERLMTELSLRESENKFRGLAEQSIMGVLLFNDTGEIFFANKEIEKIYEYNQNEIYSFDIATFMQKVHTDYQSASMQEVKETLKEILKEIPPNITQEYEIITKHGKRKWISIYLNEIKLAESTAYSALVTDITERKRMAIALENERIILKTIAEYSSEEFSVAELVQNVLKELLTLYDFDFGTVRIMDYELNLLDIVTSSGIDEELAEIVRPIYLDDETKNIALFARERRKIFTNDLTKEKDFADSAMIKLGKIHGYIAYPIVNAQNLFLGSIHIGSKNFYEFHEEDEIFFQAIADTLAIAIERIHSLEQLRISQKRFKQTVDNMSDGIIIIENNRTVYVNDRVSEIIGYSKEELMNARGFGFIDAEEKEKHIKKLQQIISAKPMSYSSEVWINTKQKKRKCINYHISMEYSDKGIANNFFMVISDITQRKIAEQNLRDFNELLERKVKERTKQLERVNKELESFSYSVSHDLRAPLRSIDGFSKAILEDYSHKLDAKGKNYLNRVRSACQRMGTLIDDILSLSRLSQTDLALAEIDFSLLAKIVIEDFKTQIKDRKIDFLVRPNIIVKGDVILLRTVLENLIGNAIKFTKNKEEAIIEVGSYQNNDGEAIYFVKDNGVGFDMKYAHKLFKAFQRLHSQTEYEGTGIGLATVQRIIHKHKGQVWAESELDKGTKVSFTLNPMEE
jgi:PAS domain S-box-containing protein